MRKHSIGDIVRIREWDDMAAEYGMFGENIACPTSFVPGMKKYCGKERQITEFAANSWYRLDNMMDFVFSDAMFEKDVFSGWEDMPVEDPLDETAYDDFL